MTTLEDRIRALFPNIGSTYYVDAVNGQDAAGRGGRDTPLKTINYAIDNYVSADNGDLVACFAPGDAIFDEADILGLQIDLANTTVLGIGTPKIKNTATPTSEVVRLDAKGCKFMGFDVVPNNNGLAGITVTAPRCVVGDKLFPNHIDGPCLTGIFLGSGSEHSVVRYNQTHSIYGIALNDTDDNLIEHNNACGPLGDVGVSRGILIYNNSLNNVIRRNDIKNYGIGVEIQSGSKRNTVVRNTLNCYNSECNGTNTFDANGRAARRNLIANNIVPSLWFSSVKTIPGNVLTLNLYDETVSGVPYKDGATRTWWLSLVPGRIFPSGVHTATITFKEYDPSGNYVGRSEHTIPVGTNCGIGCPSNTLYFSSRNTIKIDITLDAQIGSDVDATVIVSADTVG